MPGSTTTLTIERTWNGMGWTKEGYLVHTTLSTESSKDGKSFSKSYLKENPSPITAPPGTIFFLTEA